MVVKGAFFVIRVIQAWFGIFNVKYYGAKGDGTTDDTNSFNKLIVAVGALNRTVIIPTGSFKLSSNITFPININVMFINGGMLSPDITKTVTISGKITAGEYQIFSGLGTITGLTNVSNAIINWWGAKSGFSSQAAIQLAVNAIPASGTLKITDGEYLLDGTGTEQILITKTIRIVGNGASSKLIMLPTVPSTSDALRLSPPANDTNIFGYLGNFQIIGTDAVITNGRHAIVLDATLTTQHFSNMIIERLFTIGLGGNAIKLINPVGTDAFFTSTIQDCLLYGGINLERSGDSVNILRNTITGAGIGINISTVVGAAMTIIEDNNITTAGGGIALYSGNQVKIRNNQIEQSATYTGSLGASVYIKDSVETEIDGNNINAHNNVDFNILIAGNSSNTRIGGNTLDLPNNTNIAETSTTVLRTNVQKYGFYTNSVGTPTDYAGVLNSGFEIRGYKRNVTLGSGATAYDTVNFNVPAVKRHDNGQCELYGAIVPTLLTAGTIVFNVPQGFRPLVKKKYVFIPTYDGTTVSVSLFTVELDGAMTIVKCPAGVTRFILDGIVYSVE